PSAGVRDDALALAWPRRGEEEEGFAFLMRAAGAEVDPWLGSGVHVLLVEEKAGYPRIVLGAELLFDEGGETVGKSALVVAGIFEGKEDDLFRVAESAHVGDSALRHLLPFQPSDLVGRSRDGHRGEGVSEQDRGDRDAPGPAPRFH